MSFVHHHSVTTTDHTIDIPVDRRFAFSDADAISFHVGSIEIRSVDGVLQHDCTLAGNGNSYLYRDRIRWQDDERVIDLLCEVGLVDPRVFTVDWAEETLRRADVDPIHHARACVTLRDEFPLDLGRALKLVKAVEARRKVELPGSVNYG